MPALSMRVACAYTKTVRACARMTKPCPIGQVLRARAVSLNRLRACMLERARGDSACVIVRLRARAQR